LQNVSRICCPGRVVSVLEGGYGQWRWVKVPLSVARTGSVKAEDGTVVHVDARVLRAAAEHAGLDPETVLGPSPLHLEAVGFKPAAGAASAGRRGDVLASEVTVVPAPHASLGGDTAIPPPVRAEAGDAPPNSASSAESAAAAAARDPVLEIPYLRRDNLAENCAAHLRALVDDGGLLADAEGAASVRAVSAGAGAAAGAGAGDD
jgi:hypothetical protein